eukprot:TRINITY_DN12513_c0_g1_i1.p1 TRINITY_DN12513_c0_g1~~TRINITY_DN12513_c0_g1_i1.p1  ORF type:complete len:303 (-),score=49.87 TRINITY_DN12513_c0_g1_i1:81-863(-)
MNTNKQQDKKIIFLWTHPRSLSTAFERAMVAREDMEILHEPFGYLFYLGEGNCTDHMGTFDPSHPTSYEGIKKMIIEKAAASDKPNLFVKDMACHCLSHILKDKEFLSLIDSTFLVRDPLKSISSHYNLNKNVKRDEIGYDQAWTLFQRVAEVTGKNPPIIIAEELEENPAKALEEYAKALGLPPRKDAVNWDESYLDMWDTWKDWHEDVARSKGFHKTDRTKHEQNLKEHPHLQEMYQYHLPLYQKFCNVYKQTVPLQG